MNEELIRNHSEFNRDIDHNVSPDRRSIEKQIDRSKQSSFIKLVRLVGRVIYYLFVFLM